MPLTIAAKVDRAGEAYFRDVIQPLLSQPHVEFVDACHAHASLSVRPSRDCRQ